MSRKKKNDFWDDVDDKQVVTYDTPEDEEDEAAADEDWSLLKSTPVKVIMRILLMISCLAALLCGYIVYQYIQDRYAGGSYSADFFDSASFAGEYNNSVDQLISMIQAMESDSNVTSAGNEELLTTMVENYMGKDTNFSFLIQDQDHYAITSSGDDAKDRIESSSHYALITNTDGEVSVRTSLADSLLDEDKWSEDLSQLNGQYIIYTAVDNDLTYQDSYYAAQQNFERMGDYFSIARIVGIVALIIFIICLIFCIMATGQRKGYRGVYLSGFDRIFTELAVVIMAVVAGILIWAVRHFMQMDGALYRYLAIALIIVTYGWITRSYFSIVRRIKAGRLFRCSIVGQIVRGVTATVGRLPYPVSAIIEAILLIIVNGAVVYAAVRERAQYFHGVRVSYIIAGVAGVIELVGILSYATGGSGRDDEEEYEENATEDAPSAMEELSEDISEAKENSSSQDRSADTLTSFVQIDPVIESEPGEEQDWETMDLSKVIATAEKEKRAGMEAEKNRERVYSSDDSAIKKARENHSSGMKTQVLSEEEMEKALRDSGIEPDKTGFEREQTQPAENGTTAKNAEKVSSINKDAAAEQPEDSGRVNFVQLNKDIRKRYRPDLKARGIIVTMRSPEKPVIIDMDKSSLSILISNIFDQIERLSADNVKNYLESYVRDGKVVYIAKINIADNMKEEAEASVSDGSFDDARKIVEANDGRFVAALEGSVLRVGMLMDAAQ